MKSSNEKVALYIDSSSFLANNFISKFDDFEAKCEKLAEVLRARKDVDLLVNDILFLEIFNNIDKVIVPREKLKQIYNDSELDEMESQLQIKKDKIKGYFNNLRTNFKTFSLNIDDSQIIDGCKREYEKKSPWAAQKNNEWKDYFVQESLLKYYRENSYSKLYISSRDNGFLHLEDKNENITVIQSPLHQFIETIDTELQMEDKMEINAFKNYIINCIYRDEIYDEIMRRITYDIEEFYQFDCDTQEIIINDIKIIDPIDINDNPIEMKCIAFVSVYGYEVSRATWDNEDKMWYGGVKIEFEFESYIDLNYEHDIDKEDDIALESIYIVNIDNKTDGTEIET